MERKGRRGRDERGVGWLSTLAGATLLMVMGFGVGLVAGAAFEEPDLVMDHLRGRTTEVPLSEVQVADAASDPAEGLASVASSRAEATAPAPLGASLAPSTGEGRPAEARAPLAAAAAASAAVEAPATAPAPVAARPPPQVTALRPSPAATGYSVQVGAFGERSAAGALTRELRKLGFAAEVVEEKGRAPYKVRVGPVPTRPKAEALASELKRKHRLPTWVISQGPS
jgi:cell division septation protein DedD